MLHEAAYIKGAIIFKAFIDLGYEVNALDKEGKTALMIAAERRFEKHVQLLLEAGVDVHIKASCRSKMTALKYAWQGFKNKKIIDLLKNMRYENS